MRRRALAAALALGALSACGGGSDRWEGLPDAAATPRAERLPVESRPALLRTGPGGHPFEVSVRAPGGPSSVHRTIGRRTFELALRAEPLAHHPCTSCHAGPVVTTTRPEDAHQNVQASHPSTAAGACGSCHARNDVEQLVLQTGETAPLEESYRLCAQCHYRQVDSWAGGAHGKRLDGWSGPRVVMGCGDCHDPHEPVTPRLIPFPGPTLPGRHAPPPEPDRTHGP